MEFKNWEHVTNGQNKFYYSFTSLMFITLALSIQFSPKMGNLYSGLLVLSWIIMFVSACVGGWRLLQIPNLLRLDFEKQDRKKFLSEAEKAKNYPGRVIGELASDEKLKEISENIKAVEKYSNRNSMLVERTAQFQMVGFLIGTSLNLFFVSANYLK